MIPTVAGVTVMGMSATLEQIDALAERAHAGQVRKFSGEPYIEHPRRVAASFPDHESWERYKAAGLLHDVLEDTAVTELTLVIGRVDPEVIKAVAIVTRRDGETYEAFIERVRESANPIAVEVKIADLRDNLRDLPQGNESLFDRYVEALRRLEVS